MVRYNATKKEVLYKIVYYGPMSSGTTTNLKFIEQNSSYARGNKLTSLATEKEKDLNFDFLSLNVGTMAGLRTTFQLFGVPGGDEYTAILRLILQNIDAIIFVADSCLLDANVKSMNKLETALLEQDLQLNDIPLVIQWNKRDANEALPLEELKKHINYVNATEISASATIGDGVFDTFEIIADRLMENNYKLISENEKEKPSQTYTPFIKPMTQRSLRPIQETQRKELKKIKNDDFSSENFCISEEKNYAVDDKNHIILLRLKGKIDKKSVTLLKDKLQQCYFDGNFRIVLDFKDIEHMQSTAFGMIIEIANKAKIMGGEVRLVYVKPKIKTFFEMMGVQNFLGMYDNEEVAISAFNVDHTILKNIEPPVAVENEDEKPNKKQKTATFKQIQNTKKIFISHAPKDLDIAKEIEKCLIESGYDLYCYQTDEEWEQDMTETLSESDSVILVCSENSEIKTFFHREWAIALFMKKQVVPCFVKEVFSLPLPLQNLPFILLEKFDNGIKQLLSIINSIAKNRLSQKIPNIDPLYKNFFLEPAQVYYSSTKPLLDFYLQLLDKTKLFVVPESDEYSHGIGKTEFVCQFLRHFAYAFADAIIWINAANNLENEYVAAAKNLDIPYDKNHIKYLLSLKSYLQENKTTLMVVDNIYDVEKLSHDVTPGFTPLSCNCHSIYISHDRNMIETIHRYPLPARSLEKALNYLISIHKSTSMLDDKTLRELCNRVACYPLAITMMGAFFKIHTTISYKEYGQSLNCEENLSSKTLQAIIQKQLSIIKNEEVINILKILSLFPEGRSISIDSISCFLGMNCDSDIFQRDIDFLVELKLLIKESNEKCALSHSVRTEIIKLYNFSDKSTMRNFRKNTAQKLLNVYKEFSFLEKEFLKRGIDVIIDDFNVAFVWSEGNKEIDKLRAALIKEKHTIKEYSYFPHIVIQQVYSNIREHNRTGDLLVNSLESSLKNVPWKKPSMWFKRINRSNNASSRLKTQRILKYAGKACFATFSKNGNRIIVTTSNSIKTWDTVTGKEISTLLSKITDASLALTSPNNKYTIYCKYNTIGVWKMDEPLITKIKGHNDWILSLAFSPYSRLFSSGGRDGVIKMWSIDAGRLLRVFRGHKAGVKCISFSPRNTEMISGGIDKNIILWSLESNKIKKLQGHFDIVTAIAYSNDGLTALSGSKDCLVKLWDTKTGEEIFTFSGHKKSITSVVFSPNNKLGISTSLDGSMILWCLETGRTLQIFVTDRVLLTSHFDGNEIRTCNNSMIPIVYHFSLEENLSKESGEK